jgi:hypothetical protein
MASDIFRENENKVLAEYRSKVRSTKWFIKRFYTPDWLQRPTKTILIMSFLFWTVGVSLALFYRPSYQTDGNGTLLIDLMLAAATLTMMGMCFFYLRGKKKKRNTTAPNK